MQSKAKVACVAIALVLGHCASGQGNALELCQRIAETACSRSDCNISAGCEQLFVSDCCTGSDCDFDVVDLGGEVQDCLGFYEDATCTDIESGMVDPEPCHLLVYVTYRQYCAAASAHRCADCDAENTTCEATTTSECCDNYELAGISCDTQSLLTLQDLNECCEAIDADQCMSSDWPFECF